MIRRKPNELWTHYLVRRLICDGVRLEPFSLEERLLVGDVTENNLLAYDLQIESEDTKFGLNVFTNLGNINFRNMAYNRPVDISEIVLLVGNELPFCLDIDFRSSRRVIIDEAYGLEGTIFSEYQEGRAYAPSKVINNVVTWVKSNGLVWKKNTEQIKDIQLQEQNKDSRKLEEVLKTVKELRMIATEHPTVLKPEGVYLKELYTQAINEDVDNLQVFEYGGKRYPYVLVDAHDLEGKPGKPFKNLYFVAREFAPEDWQQKVIALHESLCVKTNHDNARSREIELARHLGKEQEYLQWRKSIDDQF